MSDHVVSGLRRQRLTPAIGQADGHAGEQAGRRARCVPDPTVNQGDSRSLMAEMLVESISRLLLIDRPLGITAGHAELTAFVEQHLRRFEPPDEVARLPYGATSCSLQVRRLSI